MNYIIGNISTKQPDDPLQYEEIFSRVQPEILPGKKEIKIKITNQPFGISSGTSKYTPMEKGT